MGTLKRTDSDSTLEAEVFWSYFHQGDLEQTVVGGMVPGRGSRGQKTQMWTQDIEGILAIKFDETGVLERN